jgi:hypothetical protein
MSREKINRAFKAMGRWSDLREEIEALADDFEARGWEALVLNPGDVTAMPAHEDAPAEEPGFHLLVPESELEALTRFVEDDDATFDSFEVHGAASGDLRLLVVATKAEDAQRVVCYPVYYEPEYSTAFVDAITERERVYTHVTNLAESHRVSFRHDRHELFLPE